MMKLKFIQQLRGWLVCLGILSMEILVAQRPFPAGLSSCLEDDFRELEQLYNATNGDGWARRDNWFSANMASWYGINLTVDGCSVHSIDLEMTGLNGTIPNLSFTSLQSMKLSWNQLTGGIPNFNLPNLQSLNLSNNQLTGTIPNFNLVNLQTLDLLNNQLTGTIPNFYLPSLRSLSLNNNQLTGSIPNFNASNLNLQLLWLNNNQLTGMIPNLNLPNLQELRLNDNQLTGTIPNFALSLLQQLWLNNNQLEGCISSQIRTNCQNIQSGHIYNNPNLSTQSWTNYWNNGEGSCRVTTSGGTINASLCGNRNYHLPSGRIVNAVGTYADTIIHNSFVQDTAYTINLTADNTCRCLDSIQLVSLYNATNGTNWLNNSNWLTNNPINTWSGISLDAIGCVKVIYLEQNNLVGTIPTFNLPKLEVLNLKTNQLTGNIPNFNLPNLQTLILGQNQLSGSILNFNLANLPSLQTVSFRFNRLTGTLPNFNSQSLRELDLFSNQLTGTLHNFNALPNLISLELARNGLTGTIPNFNALPNLKNLGIGENALTGTIPTFSFLNLQGLSLGQNQLTGTIPNFNFPNLYSLDLGKNRFTGSIPDFNFPNLHVLLLWENQLSGCIPAGIRTHCPNIESNWVSIQNNPNLATQNWANYWNNGEGSCATIINGGNISAVQCGDRQYYLPSGRTVNAAGRYNDTIRHAGVQDTAYAITLTNDISCHCQDSVALVSFYNSTGGYPATFYLNQPMNSWPGISMNAQGCVTSWADARPDSTLCVKSNDTIAFVPSSFFLSGFLPLNTYQWYKNDTALAAQRASQLTLNGVQLAQNGFYYSRSNIPTGALALLPNLQYFQSRKYRINVMDVTVQRQANNYSVAQVTGGVSPYRYRWSNGDTTSITTRTAASITVTDALNCPATKASCVLPSSFGRDTVLLVQAGDDIRLQFNNTGLPSGNGYTYQWFFNGQPRLFSNQHPEIGLPLTDVQQGAFGLYTCTVRYDSLQGCTSTSRPIELRLGCDTARSIVYKTIRAGTNYLGFTQTGAYRVLIQGAAPNGCDSVITLHLRVLPCQMTGQFDYSAAPILQMKVQNGIRFPNNRYQYYWQPSNSTDSFMTVYAGSTYRVTVTDSIGCQLKDSITIPAGNFLGFQLESMQVPCSDTTFCTTIRLKRPAQNVTAIRIILPYDATKVRPIGICGLGRIIPAHRLDTADLNNQFTLTIALTSLTNINGNVGDTLIRINWRTAPAFRGVDTTATLIALIEESRGVISRWDSISSSVKLLVNNKIDLTVLHLNLPQEKLPASPNNQPRIFTGNINYPTFFYDTLKTPTSTRISTNNGTLMRLDKLPLPSWGVPVIEGPDASYAFHLISGNPNFRVDSSNLLRYIALDVDGNGILNGNDITEILRRSVGLAGYTRGFKQNNDTTNIVAWRYFPQSLVSTLQIRIQVVGNIRTIYIPQIATTYPILPSAGGCDPVPINWVSLLLGDWDDSYFASNEHRRFAPLTDMAYIQAQYATKTGNQWKVPIIVNKVMQRGVSFIISDFNWKMDTVIARDSSIVVASNIDSVAKTCIITTYTTKPDGFPANQPIIYLVGRKDSCLRVRDFGTVQSYVDGVSVKTYIMPYACDPLSGVDSIIRPDLRIYPNPSQGLFHLESDDKLGIIRVYDAIGRMILQTETIDNQLVIDLSNEAAGLYFVRVGNGNPSLKIIKK